MELESLVKQLKKNKLVMPSSSKSVQYHRSKIEKIIPHRDPIFLVDQINKIDIEDRSIESKRFIDPGDHMFQGHFPGKPVYPGVLQIETMGQLGLCLAYFIKEQSPLISDQARPVKGLFTKIHNAGFADQILPGDNIKVLAKMIEFDDFLGIMVSQIIKDETICAYSVLEVYFDE